jgi:osmotically-inducible protein OsmY
VKSLRNLLQVAPSKEQPQVDAKDSEVKERVETSLKADAKMADVTVASVGNGVVLLSGKTKTSAEKLRAIENAYSVQGVHKVASETETMEN